MLAALRSPVTGGPLRQCDDLLLGDGETLWPVIDGIPYLRTGRDALRAAAVSAIAAGDAVGALALLLADRKDDTIPPADPERVLRVAHGVATIGEALDGLGYGGMAQYVYHRWSMPTYLSGLALLEAHAPLGARMFEVGCGTGHFLRSWTERSGSALGGDLVFSNLWLSRRFVSPRADLVCFDAAGPFPLASHCAGFSFAHDAFHYFPRKEHALAELRRVAAGQFVLLGHVHNAARDNFSPGLPLDVEGYARTAEPTAAYDDAWLTRAALTGTPATRAASLGDLHDSQALAFACGELPQGEPARLTMPRDGAVVTVNPLLTPAGPVWPSPKFKAEFADDWPYLSAMRYPPAHVVAAGLRGEVGRNPELDGYVRERVLLELPEGWR